MSTGSGEQIISRFGEKLRNLRTRNALTMKELANRLGLASHGYISELEAGKKMPTVELVVKLSHLFGVTTDCLLKDEYEI